MQKFMILLFSLQHNKLAIKIMFMSILCLKVRISGPASWTTASAFLHTQLCACLCRCRQKALTYVISSAGGEIQSLWRKATHNNDVIEALYTGEIFRQSKQTITTAGLCNKFSVPISCPRPNKSSVFWNPSQQALCKQEAVCQHIASLGYSTETREVPLPGWQLKDRGGFMICFLDWLHAHRVWNMWYFSKNLMKLRYALVTLLCENGRQRVAKERRREVTLTISKD